MKDILISLLFSIFALLVVLVVSSQTASQCYQEIYDSAESSWSQLETELIGRSY